MKDETILPNIEELMTAGVHFGHQSRRWHPRMLPYIYGERNRVHIIDIYKTLNALQEAVKLIESVAKRNKPVLVCATKKQAQDFVKEQCERIGMHYINHRWLGGMLTNFYTVQSSIAQLKIIEQQALDGTYDRLTKKEIASRERKKQKLLTYFEGIKTLTTLPELLIVIDVGREKIAVKEAKRLAIPIIGIVDTNSDPSDIELVVPGNDDSVKSIDLYTKVFADAYARGRANNSMVDKPDEEEKNALDDLNVTKLQSDQQDDTF